VVGGVAVVAGAGLAELGAGVVGGAAARWPPQQVHRDQSGDDTGAGAGHKSRRASTRSGTGTRPRDAGDCALGSTSQR
jgi:hypothetical protein